MEKKKKGVWRSGEKHEGWAACEQPDIEKKVRLIHTSVTDEERLRVLPSKTVNATEGLLFARPSFSLVGL